MDIKSFIMQLANGAKGFLDRIRGRDDEEQEKLISPVPESTPTPTPDPFIQKGWEKTGENSYKWPDEVQAQQPQPQQQPQPEPQQPQPAEGSPLFDFEPYQKTGNWEVQQPPSQLGAALRQVFGDDDAEKAAIVMGTENPAFDPGAVYENDNGSKDTGLFQVNSNTLADFLRRKPKQMAAIGVDGEEDLVDPMKNMKVAKLILDEQGWGAWNAPKNKGYSLVDEEGNEYAKR
jgi:hypothetical protein